MASFHGRLEMLSATAEDALHFARFLTEQNRTDPSSLHLGLGLLCHL